MRVSLARPRPPGERASSFLRKDGASVILGGGDGALAAPIRPGLDSLFGPRGACVAGPGGPLVVCDTGHHRLLVWRARPLVDGTPADLVVGQPDPSREGRNAKQEPGPATLNVPTGVATAGGRLAVADAWNHRVLLWNRFPEAWDHPADVILGQPDGRSVLANRGADRPGPDTLNWCYGVAFAGERLLVADTGNRRVLVWNQVPERTGAPADLVLGQPDATSRDENAGAPVSARGMRWPHGMVAPGDALLVADAGNNRVMGWQRFPDAHGQPCDFVLGQKDTLGSDHNRGEYRPSAVTMNMPYGLALLGDLVVVADTASSRLLGFPIPALATDAPARAVAGQASFEDKGDNRWKLAQRDSVCWPYNVSSSGDTLIVADSGNNRVLLWDVR